MPHPVTPDGERARFVIVAACFGGLAERPVLAESRVPGVAVVMHDDRIGLLQCLASLRPDAVVFPSLDSARHDCAPLIERVRREACDVLPAVLVQNGAHARGLTAAMRAGALMCPWSTHDDIVAAIVTVSGAAQPSREDRAAMRALASDLRPSACVDALMRCAECAHEQLRVMDLAAMSGVSRRALSRSMRAAGWPAPSELIEWGRLFCASMVQWHDDGNLPSLAAVSGYASPQALRRSAHRLLGPHLPLREALVPLKVGTMLRRRIITVSKRGCASPGR